MSPGFNLNSTAALASNELAYSLKMNIGFSFLTIKAVYTWHLLLIEGCFVYIKTLLFSTITLVILLDLLDNPLLLLR